MRSPNKIYALLLLALLAALSTLSCDDNSNPVSASGVGKEMKENIAWSRSRGIEPPPFWEGP